MVRRTVSPLAAPIAQSIASGIAREYGRIISVTEAQDVLDLRTYWPQGTERETRAHLRDWFAATTPLPA